MKRPPIVVVMGHVDHGKTTLLDYIRKTTVASREAGGITQSIGAYEIEHNGNKITFLDTPGHEAFSKMRSRGAKVADLAILVIAADEGMKPQTKNALKYILEEKLSFVVAINKIDKPGADIDKIKQELSQNQVFLEGFGGDVSWHAISAKSGEGVGDLLDLVILASEIQGLVYDPKASGNGIILGTNLDPRRGLAVDAIVKDGTLRAGEQIFTPTTKGKIRSIANFIKKPIKEATPSMPIEILGFETQPLVGEEFSTDEGVYKGRAVSVDALKDENREGVKIILRANEAGSLEALEHVIEKINTTHPVLVVSKSIGDIYETDLKLAGTTGAVILGFKVKVDKAASTLMKTQKIIILASDIIYELEDALMKRLEGEKDLLKRAIEILATFGVKDGRQIIGGKVSAGVIKNQEAFKIIRGEEVIGEGKIVNLQSGKKDVSEVAEGSELGLLVDATTPIAKGDKLSFV